jgi:diguanylate cyclase (GGDEF)-like protein
MRRNQLLPATFALFLVCVSGFAAGCKNQGDPSAILDQAESTRLAASNPGNYGRPVRIEGVVTYYDPEWHLLFLQDASGGFFVGLKEEVPDLTTGGLVEVSGKLAPGNLGIEEPHFRLLGRGAMPVPQALPATGDPEHLRLSQWVGIHGTVHAAAVEDGRLTLTVADGSRRIKARILAANPMRTIEYVGREVHITGVSAAAGEAAGDRKGIQVFVSSLEQVELRGAPTLSDPFSSKPQAMATALEQGAAGKLLHLGGTVIEQKAGRVLVVGDGTSRVRALLADGSRLGPGDSVELLGFVSASPDYQIEDTIVRIIAPRTAQGEPHSGALRTIRELKSLTFESAAKNLPVDVRGTVTYVDPASSLLFVEDSTAGVYVDVHRGTPDVAVGDIVHVAGVSGPGDYAPVITQPTVTRLGHGALPKPLALSVETLASRNNDAGWVEIVGIVHSVAQLRSQHVFKLAVAGNSYAVQLPHAQETAGMEERLLDAQVKIRGVCGTVFNEKRQLVGLKFFVPGSAHIAILEPAPEESALAVRPIITLLRFDPLNLSIHRAKVRGAVTLRDGEQGFYVQDASAGIYVVPEQTAQVRAGQLVEVSGFAAVGADGPYLEDASLDVVSEKARVVPVLLPPEDIAGGAYRSQLVTVRGRLLERVEGPEEDTMILQAGYLVLRARLPGGRVLADARRGSLLAVTGILENDGRANQNAFRITLPSAHDVQVIEGASWWSPENAARTLVWAIIAILAVLLWVSFAAYRVRSYQARHDLLTGLPNRRSAMEYLERQMARAMRERSPLGVILADVDHFKKVNDTYGHQAGDAVLKKIAEILRAALRPYDAVGRYGGEEFLIIVPGCDVGRAEEISERIRLRIMQERFDSMPEAQYSHVTCSFGVAIAATEPWEVAAILAAADGALYAAKKAGRNRVLVADLATAEFAGQSEAS